LPSAFTGGTATVNLRVSVGVRPLHLTVVLPDQGYAGEPLVEPPLANVTLLYEYCRMPRKFLCTERLHLAYLSCAASSRK
jgi:hypothetical protein